MTERDAYLEWMIRLIGADRNAAPWRKLLGALYDAPFSYLLDMDGNRAADGADLRYRFGNEEGCSAGEIRQALDDRPCSVLEMMVALAMRCEEHIMYDSDIGNRTGEWFWAMIKSLGLYSMSNARFDPRFVDRALERFLRREYEPNGLGGLFTLRDCRHDMRRVEIWCQMMWYLDEYLQK